MKDGVVKTGYQSNRVTVIPNSSDLDEFSVSVHDQQQFRAQFDWLKERKFILYAGTLGKVNGVSYFVDLAKYALEVNPELRFVTIGDGIEKDLVRRKAQENGVLDKNFFMLPPASSKV